MTFKFNSKFKSRKAIINICIIIIVAVIIMLAWSARAAVLPFVLGLFLAYFIAPAVTALGKKGVPVGWSVTIVYLYILIGFYALAVFVLPHVINEIDTLINSVPEFIKEGEVFFNNLFPNSELPFSADELAIKVTDYIKNLLNDLAKTGENWGSSLIAFVFAPILSFYMLRDKKEFKKRFIAFLPPKERPEILRISADINYIVRQFIYGYLFVAAIVGILSGIALAFLGVPYALVLGVIVGIFNLIPYFGSFFAIAVSMAFALVESPTLALYTLIVLGAIQQFESFILSPKVIGSRTGLHPLTIIFVVLAAGHWFGILGMVLAVPVTAALKLLFAVIYSRLVAFKEENMEDTLELQTGLAEQELNSCEAEEIIDKS
ncbi:MAG: AI-2E family transporter [Bacillota bacterium]